MIERVIQPAVESWLTECRKVWERASISIPKSFVNDFKQGEEYVGRDMAANLSLEIEPSYLRRWSSAFACLSIENMDKWIWVFLRGNLLDRLEADVCVPLVASHLLRCPETKLSSRFDCGELSVLSKYFELIASLRGNSLEVELAAIAIVEAAKRE